MFGSLALVHFTKDTQQDSDNDPTPVVAIHLKQNLLVEVDCVDEI